MILKRSLLTDEENSQQFLITGQVILLQLSLVWSVSHQCACSCVHFNITTGISSRCFQDQM